MVQKNHVRKTINDLQEQIRIKKDDIEKIEKVIELLNELYVEPEKSPKAVKKKLKRKKTGRKLPTNVYRRNNKYEVMVSVKGKLQHVGIFDTLNQAVEARDSFKKKQRLANENPSNALVETYYECNKCHLEFKTKPRRCIGCDGTSFVLKQREQCPT